MCTRPKYIIVNPSVGDRLRGLTSSYQIPIPCGKCAECLCARQNSFMIRAYREAAKYGNIYHLTLTYDEDHLPLAQSVRWVDTDTGELSKYPVAVDVIRKDWKCTSELHFPRFHKKYGYRLKKDRVVRRFEMLADSPLREQVLSQEEMKMRGEPRMASVLYQPVNEKGLEYHYFETPSYDAKDVIGLIKYCKLQFARQGRAVENLRYLISPEYGERNTRRPHYHCLLINCPYDFAKYLWTTWRFGVIKSFKNGNIRKHFGYGVRATLQSIAMSSKKYKGNGYKNIAAYVSKYTCKGWLDNPAAIGRFTVPMRVHSSIGFGSDLSDTERDWYLALDQYMYDPSDTSKLSKKTLDEIVNTIVRRLTYHIPGCNDSDGKPLPYKLPDSLRKRIFDYKLCKSRQDFSRYLRQHLPIGQDFPVSGKSCYNAIYYAVSDFLRNKLLQEREAKFADFVSHFPSENLSAAVAAFELREQVGLQQREENHRENLLRYIRSTKY